MILCYLSKIKPYRFRILALLLFILLLISTWFMFHQAPRYPKYLHLSLRTQLKQLITDTLSKKNPSVENIQFQKMWTQDGDKPNTIIANFQYSFDDKETNTQVSGKATIVKQHLPSAKDHELWLVQSIQTDDTTLEFQKPMVLFSDPHLTKTPNNHQDIKSPNDIPTENSK